MPKEGPREAQGGPREGPGGPREGPGKAQGPGRAQGGPRGCSCLADKFYYATDHFGPWGAQGPILRGVWSQLNLSLQSKEEFRANSSLLCRARFIQSNTIPCSQEQGRVQANCSLLYRGRFIQRKREGQGPTRKRARKSQSAHRQAEQGRENLVHPNFRARKSLEETRIRARKSIVPRAL